MKARYTDIIDEAGDPYWWDENGTPRYRGFEPSMCADVNARQAMLLGVKCLYCGRACDIVVSSPRLDLDIRVDLASRDAGALYGLLPHFKHCGQPARATLSAVHETWRRDDLMHWRKV